MEALFDAVLRTFQNLSREGMALYGRMAAFVEIWHIAVFVLGIWLLVTLTRPGVGRS